jgi:hypothetical protein
VDFDHWLVIFSTSGNKAWPLSIASPQGSNIAFVVHAGNFQFDFKGTVTTDLIKGTCQIAK